MDDELTNDGLQEAAETIARAFTPIGAAPYRASSGDVGSVVEALIYIGCAISHAASALNEVAEAIRKESE